MSTTTTVVDLLYLLAAVGFVVALHLMNSPATARRGSRLSWVGMAVAVGAALASVVDAGTITATGWTVLGVGAGGGAVAGLRMARQVKMTAVPQLVSVFNAVGGGAAALVAAGDFVRLTAAASPGISTRTMIATVLDALIGPITFSGSLIAAGKLQGWISGQPVVFRGARLATVALTVIGVGGCCYLLAGNDSRPILVLVICAALAFGITMVMPIGGADMPVVVALLNAFTGIAVALAGFVIDNGGLIIGGALVGASGGILTVLMAQAMNRSVLSVMVGGFGTGDAVGAVVAAGDASIRQVSVDDAAVQLAYAAKVMVVPGYGLAAAQAQRQAADLAALLQSRGVNVLFAIHPVAGRMPGHMNVLLAEANVPYTDLAEMEAANLDFPTADVALVIGANDVTNPAARRPGNPVSGMPILNVDHAKSVIVIKRSMGHGYAGIDNELYTDAKTGMLFADARAGLSEIIAALKVLVSG